MSCYDEIQGKARAVFIAVAQLLTDSDAGLIAELIDHDEPAVALDLLSEMLVTANVPVEAWVLEEAVSLASQMELPLKVAKRLRTVPTVDGKSH